MRTCASGIVLFGCVLGSSWLHAAEPIGFYTGFSYGRSFIKSDGLPAGMANDLFLQSGSRFNEQTDSWKLSAGYSFSSLLSVEAAYVDLGNTDGYFPADYSHGIPLVPPNQRLSIKGSALTIAPVVSWQPAPAWTLSARAGVAFTTIRSRSYGTTALAERTSDSSNAQLLLGGAAGYEFSERWMLRVDLEYFSLGSHYQARNLAATTAYATLLYRF
jgi:hypothetical protein